MKYQTYISALIISLVFIVTAACQRDHSLSSGLSERTLSMAATASPTADLVNPTFVVTADQVRKAFDDAEIKGEKKQAISIGEEKSLVISVQDQLGKKEALKLSILFLTPLEQARAAGYSFGLNAKGKTAADRKDFEDGTISKIIASTNQVAFRVFLQQPASDDSSIPSIAFRLLDKNGGRIDPSVQPDSLIAPAKDLLGSVGLAQQGGVLTFPLFAGSSPHLTTKMSMLSLIVEVDGKEQSLQYALKH